MDAHKKQAKPTLAPVTGAGLAGLLCLFSMAGGAALAAPLAPPAGSPGSASVTAESKVPPPWVDDATLTDVHFVDARRGWAVGDRGAIWHTTDGGANWWWQPSGVDVPLTDVHFADAHTGWVVGGQSLALSPTSSAVLLLTRDGGRTWQSQRNLTLPALSRVGFDANRQNWALGEASALHPSGLFIATARGRGWSTLPGPYREGWLDGLLTSPTDGVLVDERGQLWQLRGLELRAAAGAPRQGRAAALAATDFGLVWAAGQRGLVVLSRDGGRTWQPPFGPLPPGAEEFDWLTASANNTYCCLAGRPGSQALVTTDAGQTWRMHPTGHLAPLRAVSFPTSDEGWAVGSLGAILHTGDGGATWTAQRGGARRAAALVLTHDHQQAPLEIIARLAGEDGYRVAVEVIATGDDSPSNSGDESRAREAMVQLGVADVHFCQSLSWNRHSTAASVAGPNAKRGSQEARLQVSRAVHIWRPEIVLVVDAAEPQAALVRGAAEQVCRGVGAEAALADAGPTALPAWRPRRLWLASAGAMEAEIVFRPEQMAPRAGSTLGDVATGARRKLQLDPSSPPIAWGLKSLFGRPLGDGARRDPMAGLQLPHGGDSRRAKVDYQADATRLRQAALRRRHVTAILSHAADQGDQRLTASIGDLIAPLDRDDTQRALLDLAAQAERGGNWQLAAEACQLLSERAGPLPAGAWAAAWLMRYWASDEIAWRTRTGDGAWLVSGSQVVGAPTGARISTAVDDSAATSAAARDELAPLNPAALAAYEEQRQQRLDNAARWLQRLERDHPARLAEPDLQFAVAAWSRQRGRGDEAFKTLDALASAYEGHAWGHAASAELGLVDLHRPPDRTAEPAAVTLAAEPPLLDGALDDACWRRAQALPFTGQPPADPQPLAELRMACDGRFLYLGFRAPRASELSYAAATRRLRDVDLSALDRWVLTLDTDRDRSVYYRLTVASDGSVADALADDVSFNPRWFVATRVGEAEWSCEAAIPFVELTASPPGRVSTSDRAAWLLSAARCIPGGTTSRWPAGDMPRGAAGLVTFDDTREEEGLVSRRARANRDGVPAAPVPTADSLNDPTAGRPPDLGRPDASGSRPPRPR